MLLVYRELKVNERKRKKRLNAMTVPPTETGGFLINRMLVLA